MFFKMITLENGYKLSEKHLYKYFDTPMDYLQKCISGFQFRQGREQKLEVLPFSSLVKPIDMSNRYIGSSYREQCERVVSIVEDTNKELQKLYINYDEKNKDEKEEVRMSAADLKQECVEYINDLCINETTMYLLLKTLDKKEYRHIQKRIFETLFGTPNKTFFKMIIDNCGNIGKVVENKTGNIKLYNFTYEKEKIIA